MDLQRSTLIIVEQISFRSLAPRRGNRSPYMDHALIEERLQQLDEIAPLITGLVRAGALAARGAAAVGRGVAAVGRGAASAGRAAAQTGAKLGQSAQRYGSQAIQKTGQFIDKARATGQQAASKVSDLGQRARQGFDKARESYKTAKDGYEKYKQLKGADGSDVDHPVNGVGRGANPPFADGDADFRSLARPAGADVPGAGAINMLRTRLNLKPNDPEVPTRRKFSGDAKEGSTALPPPAQSIRARSQDGEPESGEPRERSAVEGGAKTHGGGPARGPRGAHLVGDDSKCVTPRTKTSTSRSPQGTKRCNTQTPGRAH